MVNLTLSNSFSTLKSVRTILSFEVILFGRFKGWIVVVWDSVDLIYVSFTMGFLGGLRSPGLGLRSYLLFNFAIKNSEKA